MRRDGSGGLDGGVGVGDGMMVGWKDGWLVLHFLLSPCSNIFHRVYCIYLFDMFFECQPCARHWSHMMDQMGSPVSVNSV